MKPFLSTFVFLLLLVPLSGQIVEYEVFHTQQKPILDGSFSPAEYSGAIVLELAFEHSPGTNTVPPLKTTGYILRDADALYIAFVAQYEPNSFRSTLTQRDEAWNDDFLGIGIDAFSDTRAIVFLGCNASGVQLDLRNDNPVSGYQSFDVGYNVIYQTATKAVDSVYVVEMRIPFSSLQFPKGEEQSWKFSLFRQSYFGAQQHHSLTFPINRDIVCGDCQYDDVLIMHQIQSAKRWNALPFVLGTTQETQPIVKVGGSFFAGLSSQTSLEGAILPDFSQVESDAMEVEINSPYALYYPEKRPFFNEGSDLLRTKSNLLYSRTIAQPVALAKMIHQGNDFRMIALSGFDKASPYLVPGEDYSVLGQSGGNWASLLRFTRPMEHSQFVGGLFTHRTYVDGGSGTLAGSDYNLRLTPFVRILGEAALSYTMEPRADWISDSGHFSSYTNALDGEKYVGLLSSTEIKRDTKHWVNSASFTHIGSQFRAEMGFAPKNNLQKAELGTSYKGFPNKKWIKSYSLDTELWGIQTTSGQTKTYGFKSEANAQFGGSYSANFGSYYRFMEEYKGHVFENLPFVWVYIGYAPRQWISMNYIFKGGQGITRNESDVRVGRESNHGAELKLQWASKARISFQWEKASMLELNSSTIIYDGWIGRADMNYTFSPFLHARLIIQRDAFDDSWSYQPLLQYKPSAFSLVFVGGTFLVGDASRQQFFAKWQQQLDFQKRKTR